MKLTSNRVPLLATGLIAILGAFPGFAGETKLTPVASEHLAVLEKFRTEHVKRMQEGKPEKVLIYYAEDVRLMPEYQETVLGKANAAIYWRAFAGRFEVKGYQRDEIEILDLGSRIVEYGHFTMKLTRRDTAQENELAGKYLDIWEKFGNGGLSLITAGWNYDNPLTWTDALRFTEVPAVRIAFQGRAPVKDDVSFELAALNRLLEVAVSQHDVALWSQFYADDSVLMPNYVPLCYGRKAVHHYLEEHVKYLPIFEQLDIRNDRIDELGNYVIEYASHVANWRNGESSGVNTGKDLRIWRREPDGALKIFRHIGMYD